MLNFILLKTVKYPTGSIIGRKEFLFDLNWSENIFGNEKGYCMKLKFLNHLHY